MCRPNSVRGRRSGSVTGVMPATGPGTRSWLIFWLTPTPTDSSTGPSQWTRRSVEPTNTARTSHATQGDPSNYTNLRTEPADHAVGRSPGGLGTKIHQLSDGNGRPLVLLIGPGQARDSPVFPLLMKELSVARIGPGRARTRPDAVLGDKAYSSKANRAHLRSRGIEAVISEPNDQKRNRLRRGSRGGRPVGFDTEKYKGRNVVERSFCTLKQWRALATPYDKLALTYRAGVMLSAVCTGLRRLAD